MPLSPTGQGSLYVAINRGGMLSDTIGRAGTGQESIVLF